METTPNFVQVVMGPRQVGKTTAIREFLSTSEWPSVYDTADLLSPPSTRWIEERWMEARAAVEKEKRALLVLDEVQKIPHWSDAIKRFHDEDAYSGINLRVILLGSSALMVQKGLRESLAGRFEVMPFGHWTYNECKAAFGMTLDEFLFFGGYPGATVLYQESGRDETRWQQYVRDALIETVIGKDILLLTPVEKPALFRQVFHLACAHPAEILAYVKMLGQLQEAGNTTTIASYLNLLQAAGLVASFQRYSGSEIRQRASSPKLVVLSNALINATMARYSDEVSGDPARRGRLVENCIGAHLYNELSHRGGEVFYWRERDDEVDYVVRLGEEVIGIEVKTGIQKGGRGIGAFKRRYDKARVFVIGGPQGDFDVESFLASSPSTLLFGR